MKGAIHASATCLAVSLEGSCQSKTLAYVLWGFGALKTPNDRTAPEPN
jgi:hypothetical protein